MNPTLVAFVFAVVNSNILSRVQIQLLVFQYWAGRFRVHLARRMAGRGAIIASSRGVRSLIAQNDQ